MKILPVILSGGAGTRLWPVSRKAHPKPFMTLGGSTLLRQALDRGMSCGAEGLMIVTSADYQFLTQVEIDRMHDEPEVHMLLEPEGRNTAPAIALAALAAQRRYGDEVVMIVLPADHLIPDEASFVTCALDAAQQASQGRLVVFGILPTGPETGYGYLEVASPSRDIQRVLRFVEKPDLPTAQAYLASGCYFWNSGMFCFTAGAILEALAANAPHVMEAARHAFAHSLETQGVRRFDSHAFAAQPDISIDYAVMEKAANVTVVPARFGWSDVGSWPAVAQAQPADANGNTFVAEVAAVDTRNTFVQVHSHGAKVVGTVGVRDMLIIDTPDALLVASRHAAQNVKAVVDMLKSRGHDSVKLPAEVHRPWGTYTTLKEETGYKVKRITVRPGQSLSLQYHHQRAEHWVVVQGTALVQIGDAEHVTQPGQYRYIPVKEKHRLTNVGQDELVLIEVQCGAYLGEDDIVRLQDVYGRA